MKDHYWNGSHWKRVEEEVSRPPAATLLELEEKEYTALARAVFDAQADAAVAAGATVKTWSFDIAAVARGESPEVSHQYLDAVAMRTIGGVIEAKVEDFCPITKCRALTMTGDCEHEKAHRERMEADDGEEV